MFFYSKLYIWHPGDIFVWHKLLFCHLQATSSLPLPHFAMTFDFKSKLEQLFTFFTSLTHSSGPLRKLGLSSAGSKGHVCWLWLVDFDPCCLFRLVEIIIDNWLSRNVLLFSCNPIGQLCLGGPGYSSCNVIVAWSLLRTWTGVWNKLLCCAV